MVVHIREWCLCVYPAAMGPVQRPCCNGLITGDTPWALEDANYHLTGSYYMGGDKIRWWCTLGSAVCVSTQLPWALAVQRLQQPHHGGHTMGTWGCQLPPHRLLLHGWR